MQANFPWMKEIQAEILEGRAAKAKVEILEDEVDSCYIKVEDFKEVNDSLLKVIAIKDTIQDKQEEKQALTEEQMDNLEEENDGLKKKVKKEKAQKWTFVGIITLLAAAAAYLGLR